MSPGCPRDFFTIIGALLLIYNLNNILITLYLREPAGQLARCLLGFGRICFPRLLPVLKKHRALAPLVHLEILLSPQVLITARPLVLFHTDLFVYKINLLGI